MTASRTKSGWITIALIVAIFGLLVFGITWRLRSELRARVLQREAEAIHSVVLMQLAAEETRSPELAGLGVASDAFAAVLESSRLRGVLGVQLFDRKGVLQAALPENTVGEAELTWVISSVAKGAPVARFVRRGSLAALTGSSKVESRREVVPMVELAIPLMTRRNNSTTIEQVAHYWIDGTPIAREFALMDRGLAIQSGGALLGGSLLIGSVLLWAFRRLNEANRTLRAQSADLVRANQELAFSARTAAIGAISAHLFHGLKNPLAGLEGFVKDGPPTASESGPDEAWQLAVDTTRRLREMINDVLRVLRDESSGAADYAQPAAEIVAAVSEKVRLLARAARVEVKVFSSSEAELSARTANLASLVLVNLLHNAIEATPSGGQVEVDLGDGDSVVEFHVRDHGAGLTQLARANLFQPTVSAKKSGGGIGLAISHQLARHAGGQLELVETGVKGTIFRLRVPRFSPQRSGAEFKETNHPDS